MLHSNDDRGHSCLIPDFSGNAFNVSPLSIMFAVCLSYIVLIMLRYVPSILLSGEFYHKWILNFLKGFLCIYWDNHMVLIFQFVNVVYYIDWFAHVEESLHPLGKAHLVRMYDLFHVLLDSDARILLRIFAYVFISDICLYVASLSGFGIRVMVAS